VPLTLEQASTIVDVALAEGTARGFAPICVAVLDPDGDEGWAFPQVR
jgi:uncharacterized protein GlcG (DUF336 family)